MPEFVVHRKPDPHEGDDSEDDHFYR
jgi:hypothetical protein